MYTTPDSLRQQSEEEKKRRRKRCRKRDPPRYASSEKQKEEIHPSKPKLCAPRNANVYLCLQLSRRLPIPVTGLESVLRRARGGRHPPRRLTSVSLALVGRTSARRRQRRSWRRGQRGRRRCRARCPWCRSRCRGRRWQRSVGRRGAQRQRIVARCLRWCRRDVVIGPPRCFKHGFPRRAAR